jgi:archaeal flagellin N-terminal-like domain
MKKAISPIIATLVLIVIVVISAFIIYVAVSGFIKPQVNPRINIVGKAITSEEGKKGIVIVTIVNTGDVPLKIRYLKVLDPGVTGPVCYYEVKNVVNSGISDSGFSYLILGEPEIPPLQSFDLVFALRPTLGNLIDKIIILNVIVYTPQNTEFVQLASFKYQPI